MVGMGDAAGYNFYYQDVILIWIIVGQERTELVSLDFQFSFLSPSLLGDGLYRLKYCLKEPLNPKQPKSK